MRVFRFRLFDLLGSFFAVKLFRVHERVFDLVFNLLFGSLNGDSAKFGVNGLDGLEFDDIKVSFASFVDFIGDEMAFNLGNCQSRHELMRK
jgi:hypothetical protein